MHLPSCATFTDAHTVAVSAAVAVSVAIQSRCTGIGVLNFIDDLRILKLTFNFSTPQVIFAHLSRVASRRSHEYTCTCTYDCNVHLVLAEDAAAAAAYAASCLLFSVLAATTLYIRRVTALHVATKCRVDLWMINWRHLIEFLVLTALGR